MRMSPTRTWAQQGCGFHENMGTTRLWASRGCTTIPEPFPILHVPWKCLEEQKFGAGGGSWCKPGCRGTGQRWLTHLVVVSNSKGKMMSLLLQIWQMKPRWVHRSQL